jgi:tRNA/rRNA methyltransferase
MPSSLSAPVIILVRPQLVENIGTVARAMMNCGLSELRLVSPRDAWPLVSPQKERIVAAAAGAESILENANVFETVPEALNGLHTVFATSARTRDMVKETLSPRAAIAETGARIQAGEKIGLMFGPERTGLINEDLICAEKIISIPANPEFSSFNLAQAVLVLAYEWQVLQADQAESHIDYGKTRPATKDELFNLFTHLEQALEEGGFYTSPEIRPAMTQNVRNAILRAGLTEQEVRTWHGMIAALTSVQAKAAKKRA